MNTTEALDKAVSILGSNAAVGRVCGSLTHEAVRKWRKKGRMPRTEYTGETIYAQLIAKATNEQVTIADLLGIPAVHKARMSDRVSKHHDHQNES